MNRDERGMDEKRYKRDLIQRLNRISKDALRFVYLVYAATVVATVLHAAQAGRMRTIHVCKRK